MSDAHAENCEAVLESKAWCARRRLILGIRYSFGNGYLTIEDFPCFFMEKSLNKNGYVGGLLGIS